MKNNITEEQRRICDKYSAKFIPTSMSSIVGVSDNTDGIVVPINGLRHAPQGKTSGWYIWSGEELSEETDFFKPVHAKHLIDRCPKVLKFLALPPGYKFLIDNNGYEDVWYDKNLLEVDDVNKK